MEVGLDEEGSLLRFLTQHVRGCQRIILKSQLRYDMSNKGTENKSLGWRGEIRVYWSEVNDIRKSRECESS